MSYISATRIGDIVRVWECNNHTIEYRDYPAIYEFYYRHKNGQFISIYNEPLKQFTADTWEEFKEAKKTMQQANIPLYESDIRVENKILSEHYYNVAPAKQNITFLDIELDISKDPTAEFKGALDPRWPINAVSMHHYWTNKSIVLAVPPPGFNIQTDFNNTLYDLSEVKFFSNEAELLRELIKQIANSSILSGWNSEFDISYICERLTRVLGEKWLQKMSFHNAPKPRRREYEELGRLQLTYDLYGRVHLDYLKVFKKFEFVEKQSYKLEAIAEEVLPHLPKLEYEGNLGTLYINNFNHFIRYNIRDTEILKGLEDKLGYIALANIMYHSSTGQSQHVYGTIPLADQSIINFCHYNLNKKVPDWFEGEDGNIQGAYVLYPQIGLHDWVFSIDINSLYPSAIRCVNISPETNIGYFINNTKDWELLYKRSNELVTLVYKSGDSETKPANEWVSIFKDKKWAVSGYGVVFDQNIPGIIPSVLADWYKLRKEYQKTAKDTKKQSIELGKNHEQYGELSEKSDYFDRLQFVYKIKLNSLYGALSNYRFRFFNLKNAESVTATGRMILRHQVRKVGEILDGEYWFDPVLTEDQYHELDGIVPSPSVLYGDTDSCVSSTIVNIDGYSDTIENQFNSLAKQYTTYKLPNDVELVMTNGLVDTPGIIQEGDKIDWEYTPVDYIYRHKTRKRIFKITTSSGKVVEVTEDHSCMIINNNNVIIEKKPTELMINDRVIELNL